MEQLNFIISSNLKRIRDEKNWSLDRLAKETGVSKSMLGQIERGESNPTVATVWKIAKGLKISFTTLLDYPRPEAEVIKAEEVDLLEADDGKYKVYTYFKYDESREFEHYRVEIAPGGMFSSESHGKGTIECITVFDGALNLTVGDMAYALETGDAITFDADSDHVYRNNGRELTRCSVIISYKRN